MEELVKIRDISTRALRYYRSVRNVLKCLGR